MIAGQAIAISQTGVAAHFLSVGELQTFRNTMNLADKRGETFRSAYLASVFGADTLAVIIPPSASVALALAETYDGLHRDTVRAMAARIASGGLAHQGSEPRDDNGGRRAKLTPVTPITPRPGGAAVALPDFLKPARSN